MYSTKSLVIAFILVGLSFLSGCGRQNWNKISVREMRSILVDVSLTSATFEQLYIPDSIRQVSYQKIFDKYGINQIDWDSSMAWYSKNEIDLFNNIHKSVRDSLQHLQEKLNKLSQERTKIATRLENISKGAIDSIDFLQKPIQVYSTDGNLINNYFTYKPQSVYDSTYRLVYTARFSGMPKLNHPLQMRLALHLNDSTTVSDTLRIHCSGIHQLELNIPNGKTIKKISGYIRGNLPKLSPIKVFVLDSISLVRLPSKIKYPKIIVPETTVQELPLDSDITYKDSESL